MNYPRKTKIIVTLGPATSEPDMIKKLMEAGVNVFRFNMSHAPHDWVHRTAKTIRGFSKELSNPVSILLDTQGPAIRTGDLPAKLDLKPGDVFTFTVRGEKSEETNSVDVNYDDLINDIAVGDTVLVDNGVIQMKVLSKESHKLKCEVLTPGLLGSRKHINLPGVKVNLPALTEKDLRDVQCGVEAGVDWVALSFVREGRDVQILRELLKSKNASHIKIVAKVEDQLAVKNIDEIVEAADTVMVARGDLGIECPFEELPIIQRRIVKRCLQRGKAVIVATHMLESMISNPIPTRAEVTDAANAVYEEADCIMLSGETTVGKYPVQCVDVLNKIACRIERSGNAGFHEAIELHGDRDRVAASAVHLADETRAHGICVFTRSGGLASIVAALRPEFSPIYAFAETEELCQQLCMYYGVTPIRIDFGSDPKETTDRAEAALRHRGLTPPGTKMVFVADHRLVDHSVETMQLRVF
jgi:pyruvate kinase